MSRAHVLCDGAFECGHMPALYELAVKVLDGTAFNGHFWLFYGALSDVEYTLTVTDSLTGAQKAFRNPPGQLCGRADVTAF